MTREEAIDKLQDLSDEVYNEDSDGYSYAQAIDLAIEALQTDIVRCKDCMHRVHDKDRHFYYCEKFYGQGDVSDENFCQWGERK